MPNFTEHAKGVLQAHRELVRQFLHPGLRRLIPAKSKRTPLVFYSQVAWDTVWQRPQEEALGLSRSRPVVFISPVQIHEAVLRLKGRWSFLRRLENGRLIVLSPLILSGEYRSATIRTINRWIMKLVTRHLAANDKLLYMTNSPFTTYLAEHLKADGVAYDIIDDFCAFEWAPKNGRESECKLISMADLAFAGTGYLKAKYEGHLHNLQFLPSGVRFSSMTHSQPEPQDLADLPHPRILYVGTMNDRLNADLFTLLAEHFPHGSIIAVGPRHGTFALKKSPKNLHFLGLKPHEQLPGYYQHCDLGIMPFADNDAAKAINPVKTLEYLACGLPVLSTPVPDVIKYYPEVVRTELPEAWLMAAEDLLSSNSFDKQATRQEFARGRDWSTLIVAIETRLRAFEAGIP
ncbi:glycosyltransferase [Candidatus Sumerlaeota bacterium]|nr:glycosyltransferase [Candidatus Sumerlaeota bacterium]